MSKPFRVLEKETFRAQVPPELAEAVRVAVARSDLNLSEFATVALCRAVGHDPGAYGLAPARRPRRLAAAPA